MDPEAESHVDEELTSPPGRAVMLGIHQELGDPTTELRVAVNHVLRESGDRALRGSVEDASRITAVREISPACILVIFEGQAFFLHSHPPSTDGSLGDLSEAEYLPPGTQLARGEKVIASLWDSWGTFPQLPKVRKVDHIMRSFELPDAAVLAHEDDEQLIARLGGGETGESLHAHMVEAEIEAQQLMALLWLAKESDAVQVADLFSKTEPTDARQKGLYEIPVACFTDPDYRQAFEELLATPLGGEEKRTRIQAASQPLLLFQKLAHTLDFGHHTIHPDDFNLMDLYQMVLDYSRNILSGECQAEIDSDDPMGGYQGQFEKMLIRSLTAAQFSAEKKPGMIETINRLFPNIDIQITPADREIVDFLAPNIEAAFSSKAPNLRDILLARLEDEIERGKIQFLSIRYKRKIIIVGGVEQMDEHTVKAGFFYGDRNFRDIRAGTIAQNLAPTEGKTICSGVLAENIGIASRHLASGFVAMGFENMQYKDMPLGETELSLRHFPDSFFIGKMKTAEEIQAIAEGRLQSLAAGRGAAETGQLTAFKADSLQSFHEICAQEFSNGKALVKIQTPSRKENLPCYLVFQAFKNPAPSSVDSD